jgi:hypothetical protein
MTLSEQSLTIRSRKDLAAFVLSLRKDFQDGGHAWENNTLDLFLGALAAWVDDMEGYYRNRGEAVPDCPDWKTMADMLMAARSYE